MREEMISLCSFHIQIPLLVPEGQLISTVNPFVMKRINESNEKNKNIINTAADIHSQSSQQNHSNNININQWQHRWKQDAKSLE